MTLPCPSLVWDLGDVIHFFVQMQRPYEIVYATAQHIGEEWKVAG